jgi:alanine dehydrogenase
MIGCLFIANSTQRGKLMSRSLLLLKRSDISNLMGLPEYIDVVEHAFRAHADGKTLPSGLLHVDANDGEFHIKAGGLTGERMVFGLKANGGFFKNYERYGLPNIQGVILLFDAENGTPLAVMDSVEITIQRTGAATAVAARYLANPESSHVAICGCGTQGRVQLRALKEVLPGLKHAFAYDLNTSLAKTYAQQMSSSLNMEVNAVENLADTARSSQCIVTCTPSHHYFLHKDFVSAGTFVAAVGADSPEKQEIDPALMSGNKVVVDILEQCREVGELHHALQAGVITEMDVHAELGEVITGKRPGRTSQDEIIIYDATGTALQDTAAAAALYERALERGIGTTMEITA